jgi:hypothetical protein
MFTTTDFGKEEVKLMNKLLFPLINSLKEQGEMYVLAGNNKGQATYAKNPRLV